MSVESYIVRVVGGAEKAIAADAAAAYAAAKVMVQYVDNVVVNDIDPAIENLFTQVIPAEVAALKPYVQQALAALAVNLPAVISGNVGVLWATLAPVLAAAASAALAAGKTVANVNLMAALAAVIADIEGAVGITPTAPAAAAGKAPGQP